MNYYAASSVIAALKRHVRRVALLRYILPLFSRQRLRMALRLLVRGDFAAFADRARWLVRGEVDRRANAVQHSVVVVSRAEPWPIDLPLVSVVVVCFNYGAYVEEAIASVLAQTMVERCEVIVVDGGSDDPDTLATMRRLAADPTPQTRVLLRTDGRHLVGDNRNYGIQHARGRYVACLDADDLLDPRYIEVALYLLERRGYDLVSATTQCFGMADSFFDLKQNPDLADMAHANHVTTVAVVRRELWERAGGFHDAGLGGAYVYEDWKLWVRIAALGARITNIRAPLFRYRVHSRESLSRQGGVVRDMVAHRAEVAAFNQDLLRPEALSESARRRDLDILVEGSFDNLTAVEQVHRPTVLLALPFMLIGGGERLLSGVAKHLVDAGYRIVIVTTLDADPAFGDSSPWFEEATSEIFRLPRLLRPEYWGDFFAYLVAVKRVDVLWIAGSEFAYAQLPELRRRHPDLRVADLLFNAEAHVANNRLYADHIDLHLCENDEVKDWLMAHGEEETRVLVIESGVDTSEYASVGRRRGLPLRVGFSGRLAEEKAPLAFIDLVRMLPDSRFQFVMTGAGPLEAAVRRRASRLSDSFNFLGVVDDIRAHLASLDVLVLPSLLDGRPVVVLEALAMGVPVIASRVGGLPALVRDGETGFLVDPGDTRAISLHLDRLAHDLGELERLQRSARAFAERTLSAARMNAAYDDALRGLRQAVDRPSES
jgi:glycosyltransferase involved in cell wall biosynthesis